MQDTAFRWMILTNQVPLSDVSRHFAGMRSSPFLMEYLTTVLKLCPPGGSTLETGIGNGYGAIWLSLRQVAAEGMDTSAMVVERARQVNNILEGCARFWVGDLFQLYAEGAPHYSVIHHQGVLEHFTAPLIRAALAQQVALADWVVFSVPSVNYPFDPEVGDERLLPLEVWQWLLSPFEVADLRYYGDPQWGGQEHVLGVLRGQAVTEDLLALMYPPAEPYPDGISAIVHTRNESRNIADCLQTLAWTDEIIVCDMQSEDDTVAIARQFTDQIVQHPLIQNFDRARNVSAMRARYRWILFLDADERVPAGLGPALRELITNQGDNFEALHLPFRHHFAGRWMQCLYPGYTAPRLLKNGKFVFHARLHSGAQVEGRRGHFPADNPDLALVHYSFDSLSHYLTKLNRYTDGEAANMHKDGQRFHWQNAVRHFVHDFQSYYEQGQATKDGVHGFIYSFLSAFYRWEQHAKLYETRFREGRLEPGELAIPGSAAEMLQFMLSVATEKPRPQASAINIQAEDDAMASVVWSGPLLDPSGYGEESRNFLFALDAAGVLVAAQELPWNHDEALLSAKELARLQALLTRPVTPGFVQIIQNFPPGFERHPLAGAAIGRTMFETDRLPASWVQACNRMDYIWVPSEFNRQTFTDAGVAPEKLVVIPGCFDPTPYQEPAPPTALTEELREGGKFAFLSVFDWTRHKGWDVLLRAFLEGFAGREDVTLVLKVWSTMGYDAKAIQAQAQQFVNDTLGQDLASDRRVRFLTEKLSRQELLALYQASDAFVLPSRGEGWGRPYLEAMAFGLPTIGTNWSGNTAFMTQENSYLVDCRLVAVPAVGWQELPTYQGHRWAEPDHEDLIRTMRRVVEEREEAEQKGRIAREEVAARFNRETVGALIKAELERLQESRRPTLALGGADTVHAVVSAPATSSQEGSQLEDLHSASDRAEHEPHTGNGSAVKDRRAMRGKKPALAVSSALAAPISRAREKVAVRWEGAPFVWHSLAHVNREFCLGLLESGKVELSLVPTEPTHFDPRQEPRFAPLASLPFAPLSRPADVHVRHFFPPRLEQPDEGQFVLMQPWEYGFLPTRWIEPIQEQVKEVWCYSNYVREVYRASGIAEEKLQIVPLGVDAEVFKPSAPPYVFTTEPGAARLAAEGGLEGRFVFLFVGGTLHRKGIDILLEAYLKAFSAYDEVCLVVKDTGTDTVYRGANERERLQELAQDATRPPILYLEPDLTAHQLAGVFTAADCLVQPYRGEGFCLPALEAMSCGLPVIVPEGGPTDDFVDESVGWRIPAEKRLFGNSKIGEWDCVGPTWMFEVSPVALGKQMRRIFQDREEVKRRGEAARERVVRGWTWRHACEKVLARLEALKAQPQERKVLAVSVTRETFSAPPTTGSEQVQEKDRRGKRKEEVAFCETGVSLLDRRSAAVRTLPSRNAPTISLCMIVKNEERVLDACLTSVKPWVDEIVVVDTGSTDKTVEIAQKHGVVLKHFPWCDDFSAARNESLKYATGDWLFWMDADDTLPEVCGRRLHELVMLSEERIAGIIMQVHIPPAPGESGFTIVDHVKLFRNQPEHRFEGRIHEQILEAIYRAGGKIERSDLYVVHSGYDYSLEGQKRKRERDFKLLELDLLERPDHPFVWFNIGMTHNHLKDFDKAIPALERALQLSKPHESTVRKLYAMLASCHLEQRDLASARTRVDQGLSLFPHDPELLFRAGMIYRELGDLAAAERWYLKLLHEHERGHIDSLDVSLTGFKAHHNLALIYQDMGRLDGAEAQWQAALSQAPDFGLSLLGMGELYLKQRRLEDVQRLLERLVQSAPELAEVLRQHMMQAKTG